MSTTRSAHGLAAALVAFVVAWTPTVAAQAAVGPREVEALDRQGATEIIVRREPGLSAAERADVRADAGVRLTRRSTLPDTDVVRAEPGRLAEAVARLNRDPEVVYAEPVVRMSAESADSYYGSLWGLENVGQKMFLPGDGSYYPAGTPDADMDVPEAWTKATGTGVTVGIVDTGMLTTHPDLAAQVASNAAETGADALGRDKRFNQVDDDGNGYVDDWRGWDFVTEYPSIGVYEGDSTAGPDNEAQDNHGHGTHVAGTVAAQRDNDEGIAGVAPGAKVMPLRALGSNGRGTNIAVAEAFDYAGRMGLRVVNASLGAPGLDQTQLTAIQAHPNTLYVVAAGNSNVDNDVSPHGPCALPADNIICVGASDQNDRRASFSNYGAKSVDVFAPGTAILSTHTSSAYAYLQGTSMASPNAAGVAALVLSARPGTGALDVKSAIMASTEARPDLAGKSVTGGRVNADRAVNGALNGAPVNVTAPAITGAPRQGAALGASTGHWNPSGTSYGYSWQRSTDGGSTWTAIVGATGSMYTPGAADVAARLRVAVTATNPYGVATAISAAVGPVTSGAPVNTEAPAVTGTTRRTFTLTAAKGSWDGSGNTYRYQWLRCDGGGCHEIGGATGDGYLLTKADVGFAITVVVTAHNAVGSGSATAAPTGPVAAAPPVNTRVPVITGTVQQGATLTASGFAWASTPDTVYRLSWLRCDGRACHPIPGASAQHTLVAADVGHTLVAVSTAANVDGSVSARSAETAVATMAGPRWKRLPLISNSSGRVGDTVTMTPATWSGPAVTADTTELMRCTNVCVRRGAPNDTTYTIADGDLGAILRVRETASNAGGETTVWSSRHVGPVVSAQAAAALLTSGKTRLRNARGRTLALAKLSGAAAAAGRAAAANAKRTTVTLRRSAKVKGKLVAWACPATISAGATPPPCSARVRLRKSARLQLPPSTAAKVRVVVVRSGR